MPISGHGWELHIVRSAEQALGDERRTVGRYQVFHDGVAQPGPNMSGMTAETQGPGANHPVNNGKRIEAGRYPVFTHPPGDYATWGYSPSDAEGAEPKPSLELKDTGARTDILVHPGNGFLRSVGCINLCTSLPNAGEMITYRSSRRRVIAVIDDLKNFAGAAFPQTNGHQISNSAVVIDGEPPAATVSARPPSPGGRDFGAPD